MIGNGKITFIDDSFTKSAVVTGVFGGGAALIEGNEYTIVYNTGETVKCIWQEDTVRGREAMVLAYVYIVVSTHQINRMLFKKLK